MNKLIILSWLFSDFRRYKVYRMTRKSYVQAAKTEAFLLASMLSKEELDKIKK